LRRGFGGNGHGNHQRAENETEYGLKQSLHHGDFSFDLLVDLREIAMHKP
jgi:hypothetical protein